MNDPRQLSLDLKKKDVSTSQAVLGLLLFERSRELGIAPEHFDLWAELIKNSSASDFPIAEFLGAALKLHQLEKSEGKTFEIVVEEYAKAKEELGKLNAETSSMKEKREILSRGVASTSVRLQQLENTKAKLETKVDALSDQAEELESKVDD